MISLKLRAGNYYIPVTAHEYKERWYLKFGYNPKLLEEIKNLEGAKWHGYDGAPPVPPEVGGNKVWSIPLTDHNRFRMAFLDKNSPSPYERYDRPFVTYKSSRTPYDHQYEMTCHGLTVHYAIWAAEMGTGKTLAAIELMEQSGYKDWWWVGPRSALESVYLEFEKWGSLVIPRCMTYDGLKKEINNWTSGSPAPRGIIFDESQLIKNGTSKRSQAAKHLADSIRREHGDDGFVILMTGTPAPKSPVDWHHQVQVACPGFLKEGSRVKFERRLSLVQDRENQVTGGVYPHRVTWFDDEKKCMKCGLTKEEGDHEISVFEDDSHPFIPSVNEVSLLYKRLKGLVTVKFKKDCLNLPDKIYRQINLKPKQSTLNAAKLITAKSPTTIQALTLLRELSDGFQYTKTKIGEVDCPICKGVGEYLEYFDPNQTVCRLCYFDKAEHGTPDFNLEHEFSPAPSDPEDPDVVFEKRMGICPTCNGKKVIDKFETTTKETDSPKDDLFIELLEGHESCGRFITYGGFTGTIDKLVRLASKEQWHYIRVDGRGWHSSMSGKTRDWLKAFQNPSNNDKIVFIGQPDSGGMGLTLTASPSIFYYSNTFLGQARSQSEDRIHRPGMDLNVGATIIDCFHLPSDRLVFDNLKKKRNLELTTLGELKNVMELADAA